MGHKKMRPKKYSKTGVGGRRWITSGRIIYKMKKYADEKKSMEGQYGTLHREEGSDTLDTPCYNRFLRNIIEGKAEGKVSRGRPREKYGDQMKREVHYPGEKESALDRRVGGRVAVHVGLPLFLRWYPASQLEFFPMIIQSPSNQGQH
jgi:hypothetical protein